ncbi:MAG: DEAD/DEAH box helicase [Armatimonadota bacterium]
MSDETTEWRYSLEHRQPCRLIESDSLWGEAMCRVWLPTQDTVVRVPADRIVPLDHAQAFSSHAVVCAAAASRVADALAQDVLLAPIESIVIPLPHQVHALSRAIAADRVRYLLADEVGLGKTIEAGLVMRELKLRGLVQRTLVVAPKGLVTQWISEMAQHFGEEFHLLNPSEFPAYRRIAQEQNLWRSHPQVVCSVDSVKPLDGRRGWSREQLAQYNRERFDDLISAGWDLVIVDEAHRLGGSTDQVARHRLGESLAEVAPYLLLLSATPHQGKTDAFQRLVSLLDPEAFPSTESITKERVQPYVIRTEKRRAIDAAGRPLFKPRRTQLVSVPWTDRHREQRLLYEAVTEYVREGYNQALQEKRAYIGFLMILMQRLVVSSTRAIRTSMERRLEAIEGPEEQLSLFPQASEEEWSELDGQEQMEVLLKARLRALRNEVDEVRALLSAARLCERTPDAKAEALLDWLYQLQQEEGDPELKALIFTEFVPTQEMLRDFLAERGFSVVCLNGTMGLEERRKSQEAFARKARVMVSTDAGGEGLNLQFCHVVINYDIPWNPMRLEQRIGRVDRIGQDHVVRAVNLVLEESVEHRVLEVLEEKLAVILEELGVDKVGDVLDSAETEGVFEELYLAALQQPDNVEHVVDGVLDRIRRDMEATRQSSSILGASSELAPSEAQRLLSHPLPHWVEQMVVSHLKANGGEATKKRGVWDLTWPDRTRMPAVVFSTKDAAESPGSAALTLEDPRVRGLVMRLPRFVPGQPVPRAEVADLSSEIRGLWSLWRVSIHAGEWNRLRVLPVFLHDDGRSLVPTAHHIWDQLLLRPPRVLSNSDRPSPQVFEALREVAHASGYAVYQELLRAHKQRVVRERDKGEHLYAVRRKAAERIGLAAVRAHRIAEVEEEAERWRSRVEEQAQAVPEMVPIIVLRVDGGTRA